MPPGPTAPEIEKPLPLNLAKEYCYVSFAAIRRNVLLAAAERAVIAR
jgi:hypothetical protein